MGKGSWGDWSGDVNPPCRRDCPGRTEDCHVSCETYQAFARGRKAVYAARAESAAGRRTSGRKVKDRETKAINRIRKRTAGK